VVVVSFGGAEECGFDGRGDLVGIFQEKADLPGFGFAQMIAKTGHAGHADAAIDFPISFPRLVVSNSRATKELRWLRKHTLSDGIFG